MMRDKWLGIFLRYGVGVLCWFAVFGYLQSRCVFNITSLVDGLWVKNLHDDLVNNMIGEVALRVSRGGCGATYLYTVHYHPTRMDIAGEIRSLTSLVDVATWREANADSTTVTFLDSKHKYVLHTTSDGEYIQAVNR